MKKQLAAGLILFALLTPLAQADLDSAIAAHNAENYTDAYSQFLPLAEQGDASAQYALGVMYMFGQGVKEDYTQAFYWTNKAAQQNHASAQNNLGALYKHGQGVKQDVVEAVKWYQKAAEQENGLAQKNLGKHYYSGQGIEKDLRQAFYWLQKAAQQGDVEAQNRVGVMLSDGVGTTQNHEKAFDYFSQATQKEDRNAMRNLGFAYKEGLFVDKNLILAHVWFNLAAKYGHADAAKERDALSDQLDKKQLAQAQQIAGGWQPGKKLPKVAFEQVKKPVIKSSQPEAVKVSSKPQKRTVTCQNNCYNGNCVRTFSDGRKERWQAPQKLNPFTNMWEFDTLTNACG